MLVALVASAGGGTSRGQRAPHRPSPRGTTCESSSSAVPASSAPTAFTRPTAPATTCATRSTRAPARPARLDAALHELGRGPPRDRRLVSRERYLVAPRHGSDGAEVPSHRSPTATTVRVRAHRVHGPSQCDRSRVGAARRECAGTRRPSPASAADPPPAPTTLWPPPRHARCEAARAARAARCHLPPSVVTTTSNAFVRPVSPPVPHGPSSATRTSAPRASNRSTAGANAGLVLSYGAAAARILRAGQREPWHLTVGERAGVRAHMVPVASGLLSATVACVGLPTVLVLGRLYGTAGAMAGVAIAEGLSCLLLCLFLGTAAHRVVRRWVRAGRLCVGWTASGGVPLRRAPVDAPTMFRFP